MTERPRSSLVFGQAPGNAEDEGAVRRVANLRRRRQRGPSPRAVLLWLAIALVAACASALLADEKARVPVVLDTDLGSGIGDAFALALLTASPEVELVGVTTCGGDARRRALIACRMLTAVERSQTPVAWGRGRQRDYGLDAQSQYAGHPAVLFNRTSQPLEKPAVDFLYELLKARQGEVVIVAAGPLTNVGQLLAEHPDCKDWIKRVVVGAGTVGTRADDADAEGPMSISNLEADTAATRKVLQAGVPLLLVNASDANALKLDAAQSAAMFRAASRLTMQVQALYQLCDERAPRLTDSLAAALSFDQQFCRIERVCLELDPQSKLRVAGGAPNVEQAAVKAGPEFVVWCVERIARCSPALLPLPPRNMSLPVPQGRIPRRVHAMEDFETDIERRWWLVGKLETDNVPPGSHCALRATLTQDFDGRMGDIKTMYAAAVFNPVPGPPMAGNTRLSFRYWLKGTSTLRVQLYSLTNGYHRYLAVENLPQGRWETLTVDMTKMRRPDGSGRLLAADERIDDIQFYTDPRAELIIDDIVLYEAAVPEETRPFPKRLLFTGWFDTGKQGGEWPGDFQIVPHEPPLTWKAAASVLNTKLEVPWIRLHLRGLRTLEPITELAFRYRLSGAGTLRVVLAGPQGKLEQTVLGLVRGEWSQAVLKFAVRNAAEGNAPQQVDEIHFILPEGAELLLDDVLLYEPGEEP